MQGVVVPGPEGGRVLGKTKDNAPQRHLPCHRSTEGSPLRMKMAIFGVIRMACSSMLCENLFCNPEGIESLSPGLSRFPEGLPWVEAFQFHNPERVEYHAFMKEIQPLQGCDFAEFSPRVARCSQPWAERFNPVGIGKTNGNRPNINSAFHRKQRGTIEIGLTHCAART